MITELCCSQSKDRFFLYPHPTNSFLFPSPVSWNPGSLMGPRKLLSDFCRYHSQVITKVMAKLSADWRKLLCSLLFFPIGVCLFSLNCTVCAQKPYSLFHIFQHGLPIFFSFSSQQRGLAARPLSKPITTPEL